ncbi:putative aminoacrylate hydrolase RutD [compost metagenome]
MSAFHTLLPIEPGIEAACKSFAVPDRIPASAKEADFLSKGHQARLAVGANQIAHWTFGNGPRVLLVHGWCSRGSHLLSFVEPLLAQGFSVTLFDAPGHGESDGEVSSMVHAGRAMQALAEEIGHVRAVISHSAGSMAALWAFANGLSVARSVHIGGPSSLTQIVNGNAHLHGLDQRQTQAFSEWVESFTGVPVHSLDLPTLAAGSLHPGLIIHDVDDRVVDSRQSQLLHAAWPTSRLVVSSGLGHRRILADPHTVTTAVEFLKKDA